jgi:hypothetical protein
VLAKGRRCLISRCSELAEGATLASMRGIS